MRMVPSSVSSIYQDSVMIGSSTRAPYTYTYASVPVGTYNFKAVAVDNTGETDYHGSKNGKRYGIYRLHLHSLRQHYPRNF